MEEVILSIEAILPYLGHEPRQKVIEKLGTLGVETLDDCSHVEEADLGDVLKPIHIRKLLHQWKGKSCKGTSEASVPSPLPFPLPSPSDIPAPSTPAFQNVATSHMMHVHNAVSPDWVDSFRISIKEMSDELVQVLNEKQRPPPNIRREFVRQVVKQIGRLVKKPGRSNLRIIASRIITKWPGCFDDRLGDRVIGSGFDSLLSQLEYAMDNANRSQISGVVKARKRLPTEMENTEDGEISDKENRRVDQYGYVDGDPRFPENESAETLRIKKIKLSELSKESLNSSDEIENLLCETYYLQRKMINERRLDMKEMMQEFPHLFTDFGLKLHFERLVGVKLSDLFDGLAKQANHMLSYFASLKTERVAEVLADIDAAKGRVKSRQPEVFGLLVAIAAYFGDKIDEFLIMNNEKSCEDITDLPNHPCIIIKGPNRLTGEIFSVAVDSIVVVKDITSPEIALACCFSSYFVFGIKYVDSCAATMEFMQRCFLRINPSRGSKASGQRGKTGLKKYNNPINPRVMKLGNCLSQHNSCWSLE